MLAAGNAAKVLTEELQPQLCACGVVPCESPDHAYVVFICFIVRKSFVVRHHARFSPLAAKVARPACIWAAWKKCALES